MRRELSARGKERGVGRWGLAADGKEFSLVLKVMGSVISAESDLTLCDI